MSGPTKITDLAYYLYTLDEKVKVPYFVDRPNNDTFSSSEYMLLGESWAQHGASTKRYAHRTICCPERFLPTSTPMQRSLKSDDGADKQTTVQIVDFTSTEIQLLYVRLGFTSNVMVLRCMVHALNVPAPVIGYLNTQAMYAATINHSNIFQIPGSSDILNYRLDFESTAMAALKKMCGYNTNNYSEVYIDFIDSIYCNCKTAADINAPNKAFVVPFMTGLCRDAVKMTIDGYPDICACLGKGALVPGSECSKENPSGCTEEEQWQLEFGNNTLRFACAKKSCVGDETGRVYQFAPNPVCQRYDICEQNVTANALKYDITNLKLCCGGDCAEVSGTGTGTGGTGTGGTGTGGTGTGGTGTGGTGTAAVGTGTTAAGTAAAGTGTGGTGTTAAGTGTGGTGTAAAGTGTTAAGTGTGGTGGTAALTAATKSASALCAASTPLGNDPTVQRRQKSTFAWIALIVLLLLMFAVFFK
jgi:hypothetical protein